MAAKKKARKSARKASRKARPMQVVSLKSALHMVRQAERRIRARRFKRNPEMECDELEMSNPLRHFPKLQGKGRPAKVRKWTLAMRLANGQVREKTFKSTKEVAYARAQQRIKSGTFDGQKVAHVVLDDGRR